MSAPVVDPAVTVLVVQHQEDCPPGWLGEWLIEAGCVLDVRRPYRRGAGDALPGDLAAFAGMVVLGGSMGANDDATHPWLSEVKRLVVAAAEDATPVLGICLGHQLVAVALGGETGPNPRGQQLGVLELGWTRDAAADRLLGSVAACAARCVQWNDDVVTRLPDGAVALARTPAGELQAARFAPRAWGVQGHPEAGEEIIAGWVEEARRSTGERRADLEPCLAEVVAAGPELRTTWVGMATAFASACGVRPAVPYG